MRRVRRKTMMLVVGSLLSVAGCTTSGSTSSGAPGVSFAVSCAWLMDGGTISAVQ
jgi:hypothetical protein